ncbi:MAG: hypothetical protein ACRDT6_14115 [Micromonosporaceae bacterium]
MTALDWFFVAVVAVLLLVGLGLTLWLLVVAYRSSGRQVAETTRVLWEWARERGWTYQSQLRGSTRRLPGEPFVSALGRRWERHVLTGTHRGHPARAFEHQFLRRYGVDRYLVVTISVPGPGDLEVRPARDLLMSALSPSRWRCGDEAFDRGFWIRAEPRIAQSLLTPEVRRWLCADDRTERLPFRFEGAKLVCWALVEITPEWVMAMTDFLADVADRVPSDVWR